jgi:AcrR family transcriptional regulator
MVTAPAGAARRPTSRARARTERLLVDAAVRVFARKGAGAAAIHEVAAEAGVSNGTFYNYFRSRDELVAAASVALMERLFADITATSRGVTDAAERVAIGMRRFVLTAVEDPTWSAALLRVGPARRYWSIGRRCRSSTTSASKAAAPLRPLGRGGDRCTGHGPRGDAHRLSAAPGRARERRRRHGATRPGRRRRSGDAIASQPLPG